MKNRKYWCLVLIVVLVLSLCGCKNSKDKKAGIPSEYTYDASKYDFDTWSSSSDYYQINYNSDSGTYSSDYSNVVFMEKGDGDFTILNFADIQIPAISLYDSSSDVKSFKAIADKLIDEVKPDLITFTGDFGDYGSLTASIQYVGSMLDSYGIPWAPVFGNHDNEANTVADKCLMLEGFSNCLFKTGPSNLGKIDFAGITTEIPVLGNYVVNIMDKGTLVNSLIFMNSGNYHYYSTSEINSTYKGDEAFLTTAPWGCLTSKQIDWYEWVVKSAQNYKAGVKSTLFVHIPIFAYVDAIGSAVKGAPSIYNMSKFTEYCSSISYDASLTSAVWNSGYEDSFGVFHDTALGTCRYDDFVFDSIKSCGSTNLVLCGHDHKNNIVVKYQGVVLAYGTKTGYGAYHSDDLQGATVVKINASETTIEHILVTEE